MDDRKMNFGVGVAVLGALLCGVILVVAFSNFTSFGTGTYQLFVRFDEAPGVSEGSPVRKNGILIGRVADTEFADNGEGVIVTLKIQDDVVLKQNEAVRIKGGLLGDAVLEFVTTGDKSLSSQTIPPDTFLRGSVEGNPLETFANLEGDLSAAARAVTSAGQGISQLTENLNRTLGDDDQQVQRILDKMEASLESFQLTTSNINGLLGDEEVQQELRRTIVEMPQLFEQVRTTLDRTQDTIESASRNMRNLEGLTGPLGESGGQLVGKIDSTVTKLDELLAQFVQFGRQLNEEDGSLGKLVRDPELYQNLNRAARNIEKLTSDLRPIVRDARAFSDKIARHPEKLGLRGAIKPSSGIK